MLLLITALKKEPREENICTLTDLARTWKREINYKALANVHIVIVPVMKVQFCLLGKTALHVRARQ